MKFFKMLKEVKDSFFRKDAELKYTMVNELDWTVIGKKQDIKTFTKKYNGYHVRYKYKFLKPIMIFGVYLFAKLNKKVLASSYIEPENISQEKCNRTILAWNKAIDQTCKDSQLILKKNLEDYKNYNDLYYVKYIKLINSIMINNVMWDTYYRDMFEMFAINLAKNIAEEYKNDPVHVLYDKKYLNDIDYYMAVERNNKDHIVIADNEGIIVLPRGSAIRLKKQELDSIFKALEEEKLKKENKGIETIK